MELGRAGAVDILKEVKLVLLDFDDTLCIHSSRDREIHGEKAWERIIRGENPWPYSMKSGHMQDFINICSSRGIDLGIISRTGSCLQMDAKQKWVAGQYGTEMNNYSVGRREDKVSMIKTVALAMGLKCNAAILVDDNVDTLCECAAAEVMAYSPMEVVEYIEGMRSHEIKETGDNYPNDCADGLLNIKVYNRVVRENNSRAIQDDKPTNRDKDIPTVDLAPAKGSCVREVSSEDVRKANVLVLSDEGYKPKQICEILGMDYENSKNYIQSLKHKPHCVDLSYADVDLDAIKTDGKQENVEVLKANIKVLADAGYNSDEIPKILGLNRTKTVMRVSRIRRNLQKVDMSKATISLDQAHEKCMKEASSEDILTANILVLTNAGYKTKQICEILGMDYEKDRVWVYRRRARIRASLKCADIDLEEVKANYKRRTSASVRKQQQS